MTFVVYEIAFDSVFTKTVMKTSEDQRVREKYLQILSKIYNKAQIKSNELSNKVLLEKRSKTGSESVTKVILCIVREWILLMEKKRN